LAQYPPSRGLLLEKMFYATPQLRKTFSGVSEVSHGVVSTPWKHGVRSVCSQIRRHRTAAGSTRAAGMAASGPLLPGSGPASAAGRTAVARRTAVALVLAAAAAAAAVGSVLSTYGAAGSRADAELAQFDAYVRRQRGTWDSIDARVVAPAGVQLRGARRASLSQLAERPRAMLVSPARPMSLAQARRADSTPLARKEWRDVDDIVGLMDAQKAAFSTLQQLAKEVMTAARPAYCLRLLVLLGPSARPCCPCCPCCPWRSLTWPGVAPRFVRL